VHLAAIPSSFASQQVFIIVCV